MASPLDLTSLAAAKAWTGVVGSSSDALISSLITAASRMIYGYLGRASILPRAFTDRFDGQDNSRVYLKNYPVLSVASVTVSGLAIQASTPANASAPASAGWLLDPWDGTPPGLLQALDLIYMAYCWGKQNVIVAYQAGYAVQGEAQTVPESGLTLTAFQPYGPWASDLGVTYAATGVALTAVTANPGPGQYVSVGGGVYQFSGLDDDASVLISYGFVPQDIAQAANEIVGDQFNYMSRIGVVSKSLGGQETVTFSQKNMPAWAAAALAPYRQVVVPS